MKPPPPLKKGNVWKRDFTGSYVLLLLDPKIKTFLSNNPQNLCPNLVEMNTGFLLYEYMYFVFFLIMEFPHWRTHEGFLIFKQQTKTVPARSSSSLILCFTGAFCQKPNWHFSVKLKNHGELLWSGGGAQFQLKRPLADSQTPGKISPTYWGHRQRGQSPQALMSPERQPRAAEQ